MQTLLEILKYILPALVVMLTAYLLLKSHFDGQLRLKALELQQKNNDKILPLKLQAFERLILLLERINPNSLITRLNQSGITAPELQLALISSIKNEFDHNVTQQMYVSDEAWVSIRSAADELITVINAVSQSMPSDASGTALSKSILQYYLQSGKLVPTQVAVNQLKKELQKLF